MIQYSTIDFDVVYNNSEVIFVNNLFGCGVNGKLLIFVMFHWCVEIKFDMSAHKHLVLGVEMVLFVRVSDNFISDVGGVNSPGYSIIFTPTVSLVLWFTDLCGLMSQTILPCISFRHCGTCDFGMKNI